VPGSGGDKGLYGFLAYQGGKKEKKKRKYAAAKKARDRKIRRTRQGLKEIKNRRLRIPKGKSRSSVRLVNRRGMGEKTEEVKKISHHAGMTKQSRRKKN